MTTDEQGPVIVCGADDAYAAPMTVMLRSLQDHLVRYPKSQVYVLDNGMGRSSRRRVAASLDASRLALTWIKVQIPRDRYPVSGHISSAAYARIFIPDLLPQACHKAIYLDCDMVCNSDIGELWDTPMGGKALLAVPEEGPLVGSSLPGCRELGIAPDARCLNSGVLVMDLAIWRQRRYRPKIEAYLHKYGAEIRFWDQDAINAVLAQDWAELDREWNRRVVPSEAVPAKDAPRIVGQLRTSARIIHYAAAVKAWDPDAVHPGISFFHEWLDRTQWKGWRPRPRRRSWSQRVLMVRRFLVNAPITGRLWRTVGPIIRPGKVDGNERRSV